MDELERKYREISIIRALPGARRPAAMRALAARWPGALRELERVPPAEIARRLAAVADARGDEPPRWARLLSRYHRTMRFALALRRACPSREIEAARRTLERAGVEGALSVDEADALDLAGLEALLRPPGGRLHGAVLAWIARVEAGEIAAGDVRAEIDALLAGP